MRRRWRSAAILTVAAGLLAVAAVAPAPTDAAWVDAERGTGTFTAGVVTPPTGMTCGGLSVGSIRLTWTAPTPDLPYSGYAWTVTGGFSASGTLSANATSHTLTSGLLGIGTGTFSLRAQGPGAWQSTPITATIGFVTGLIGTCATP